MIGCCSIGGWASPPISLIIKEIEGVSEAGLLGLLFSLWVNGGGTPQCSAKREDKPQQAQQPKESEMSWMKKAICWIDLMELKKGSKCGMNETKRAEPQGGLPAAASPFSNSSFCWPAVRHQKRRELLKWNGFPPCLPSSINKWKIFNLLIGLPGGEEKKSIKWSCLHSFKRMPLHWLTFLPLACWMGNKPTLPFQSNKLIEWNGELCCLLLFNHFSFLLHCLAPPISFCLLGYEPEAPLPHQHSATFNLWIPLQLPCPLIV